MKRLLFLILFSPSCLFALENLPDDKVDTAGEVQIINNNFRLLDAGKVDKTYTQGNGAGLVPIGGWIIWDSSTTLPTGYVNADGASYSTSTYSALFNHYVAVHGGNGYYFGGAGANFNVPNIQRRTLVGVGGTGTATLANTIGSTGGEETHTMTTGELATHSHNVRVKSGVATEVFGASSILAGTDGAGNGHGAALAAFDTTNTNLVMNGGSGTPFNVMQPSLVMNFIIYAGQ